jgi:hypothetical protein
MALTHADAVLGHAYSSSRNSYLRPLPGDDRVAAPLPPAAAALAYELATPVLLVLMLWCMVNIAVHFDDGVCRQKVTSQCH